jgi:hypothetical protein
MSIDRDQARRVFVLEVAGLPVRYFGGPSPSGSNLPSTITTGINYTDYEAITSVGSYTANLDPSGGVASYGAVTIELAINRNGGVNDPGVVFGRVGARATGVSKAQVSTYMPHADSAITITVDKDFSSLSYPRLFHIGAETVRASGATSTFVVVSDRGVGGTPIQFHSQTLDGVNSPDIYTEITTFRGRRASLYVANQSPDGTVSDYTELINGFIETTPTIESGRTVSISLLPLTALLDSKISQVQVETQLLQGYHYFEANNANILEFGLHIGDFTFQILSDSKQIGAGTSTSTYSNATSPEGHDLWIGRSSDHTLPNGDNTGVPHARYPAIETNTFEVIKPYNAVRRGSGTNPLNYQRIDFDDTAGVGPASLGERTAYRPQRKMELKRYELGSDEVKRFPEIINEVVNDTTNGITALTGLNGGVAAFTIDGNTLKLHQFGGNFATLAMWTSKQAAYDYARFRAFNSAYYPTANEAFTFLEDKYRAFYGIDFADDQPYPADPVTDPNTGRIREPFIYRDFAGEAASSVTTQFNIRDVARAYYQLNESVILVDSNLQLPSTATSGIFYSIEVKYWDRDLNEDSIQWFSATHQTQVSFGGSPVGYIIHLDTNQIRENNKSFGDWSGKDRSRISIGARINQESPGRILLKLLMSGGGGQVNGSLDVLGLGCNIDQSDIDINSFNTFDALSNLSLDIYVSGADVTLRELIDPMLKSMGAALVMRRSSTGKSKIALVPLGDERAYVTSAQINEGEWIADPAPIWDVYEDIVTQCIFRYDYDPIEKKFLTEQIINNQEAINRYGEERSAIELDLYGFTSARLGFGAGDRYSAFLPTFSRIFNVLSNPLRLWRGSIGTGKSIYLDVGSYITVTSSHLRGYGDNYGVTSGIGQIQSIRQELMSEGSELDIIHTALQSTGWNAAADVVTVASSTSVTISTNQYASYDPLSNIVYDGQFFQAGDVVDYLPRGDEDNPITGLTIQSVTGTFYNTVTFTAAHGITVTGGTIEPTTYASASTNHQQYAYIDQNKEYS